MPAVATLPDVGPYWVGDVPVDDITIEVTTAEGDDATFDQYTSATVTAVAPDGSAVTGFTAALDAPDVLVHWPASPSVLTLGGLYSVQVALVGAAERTTLAPVVFAVQANDGWHTLASARAQLGDDFPLDDSVAVTLLEIAKQAVVAFAPTIGVDEDGDPLPVPVNYRQAQLMQARNVLNASKTDPSTSNDGDMFVIRPYPLDNFIKQLLRPRRLGRFG